MKAIREQGAFTTGSCSWKIATDSATPVSVVPGADLDARPLHYDVRAEYQGSNSVDSFSRDADWTFTLDASGQIGSSFGAMPSKGEASGDNCGDATPPTITVPSVE
ncbi:hypothetical protein [Microbacterium enclense]|uniref:hypothetical protein n=1 Tax=Microbacterium enclense TaxID=993073 RepID=UPI003F80F9BA